MGTSGHYRKSVGLFMRAERGRRKWTQEDLRLAAGVSRGSIQSLEKGLVLSEKIEAVVEEALGAPVGTFNAIRNGEYDAPAQPAPLGFAPQNETEEAIWSFTEVSENLRLRKIYELRAAREEQERRDSQGRRQA